jgi:hypothetical protein
LEKNKHAQITILSGYPQTTQPTHPTGLWTNGVMVRLAVQRTLSFSSMFMSSAPIIIAEGTAATIRTGVYCVVSLEETAATGIINSGNGTIDLGCGMITNSTSLTAAIAQGSSTVVATPIAAVGDVKEASNWGSAELLPFTVKQPDPFGDINPTTDGCSGASNLVVTGGTNANLAPGCFKGMKFSGKITLDDGTYIVDGGDLEFGSNADVTCNSCTFVLTNSSTSLTADIGGLKMTAGAKLNLTASTSGTYNGILVYQDRRAPSGNGNVNNLLGHSDSVLSGAFYFPNQELQIGGTAQVKFACGQFVARKVTFTGNGGTTNTCTTPPNEEDFMGLHVKLVA